ncbi:hypothetical protein LMG19083_04863 [Ralstonia psammae]|uniref:DUF2827 domain-containing protein n=1 Tax=Ralstonia psammae TaxID=3058598 RepID=A0ABN9JEB2_9RALS|nr:DUF2827 domain-containing protein [Ralstonia sp. LMG 19083]CAJ0809159.1 hypothetical protein LMG19083_04863 [Ralstonia sp. LMG 19083]
MKTPKKLKVGVTLYLRAGQQSLWENGIFQNCFFLVMLLQRSPLVHSVYLVNGGEGKPEEAGDFLAMAPAPVIDLATAQERLDVVIELSAQLNPDWGRAFRARGGRIVGMHVANDYVIDIERMIFNRPQGMLISGTPYHTVWTLPAFERTCKSYYQHAMRAPVQAMPHLWGPQLLQRTADQAQVAFGYTPGRSRWRLAVLEPNICSVKTCHIPLLVADLAHRQDASRIELLRAYNTLHMKDSPDFVNFARSLDLVRQGNATFEGRWPLWEVLTRQADAIVSHHWENGQNYLYYEALYGGYPLIHNSDYLDGCGYRYDDFDCEQGALALREALATHDARLPDVRRDAQALLAKLDPLSEANVRTYTAALEQLYA